jgi:serine protease Do
MTTGKSSVFYGLLIAVTSVVAGMVIASRLDLAPRSSAADLSIPPTNSAPITGVVDAATFRTIAHDATPSVVSILTTTTRRDTTGSMWEQFGLRSPGAEPRNPQRPGRRRAPEPPQQEAGSGFILDGQGYILTNNHVIENADSIEVFTSTMADHPDGLRAKVIGRDELTDTALLQLIDLPPGGVTPSKFGDSAQMAPGDWVMAIGNPFLLSNTVTVGIVSAVGRQKPVSNGRFEDFIQTDAAINQGNSGGPLLNLRGEVIGINSMIMTAGQASGNLGIGFAVPINTVRDLLPQLRTGKVTRGRIGVTLVTRPITTEYAKELGLPTVGGAEIRTVEKNLPADRAGLKVGDVIVEVNGHIVRNNSELVSSVSASRPGTTILVKVVRDRKPLTFNVTVSELNLESERETAAADDSPAPQPETPVETEFGMSVVNLTASERRELQLPNGVGGVLVERVTPYGPAAQAPLEEGDVILSIAGAPVRSTGDVTTLLGRLTSGRVARIIVWRDREEVLVQWRKR